MTYKVVLFDVDGTLCDPGKSMIESAKYALSKLGIQETDTANLNRLIGPPLEHAFRDYYGFDEAKTNQAVSYFRDNMQKNGVSLYEAYPGITELLKDLKNNAMTLAVVTSKIEHIAVDTLKRTSLFDYFDAISAQQPNVTVDKEKILSDALNDLVVDADSSIVMIGDRRHDVEAANAHNIDSIGVVWGYGTRQELKDEGATHIVKNVAELRHLLLA